MIEEEENLVLVSNVYNHVGDSVFVDNGMLDKDRNFGAHPPHRFGQD
jgi:hypothetical protein